ncbi:MAG TPA: chorismate mutase [Bacillota bacterium]|nr:chorismate mutase [Bacillota bacterium]
MDKLRALRGAITIPVDMADEVITATRELLQEILAQNNITHDDLVSLFFTVTPDIQSEFPAVAARQLGLVDTPLMCAQEIPKAGALPLCIRVLIHFYTPLSKSEIKPVYLREAVRLRPDLTSD